MNYKNILFATLVVGILCDATPVAVAADRIYHEDFEAEGLALADVFYTTYTSPPDVPTSSVAITTNQPHGGTKCIRGNVYRTVLDSITGLPGWSSPKLNIGGPGGSPPPPWGTYHKFDDLHDDELYISWWMRWDSDANFTRGGGYAGAYKMMYINGTGGANESYNNRYNYKFSFYNPLFIETSVLGAPLIVGGANDGAWHHYEVYIKYESSYGVSDAIWRLWEDDVLWWDKTDAQFLSSPTGKINSIRFIQYTLGADASSGYQIDDIEIWDGMPGGGDTTPPDPPQDVEAVPIS